MEQKFFNFDEALEKLGISADVLNELRERGQLRAYRDGPSWKFRSDEISRMMEEGIPEPPPPSDIGLVPPEELVAAEPLSPEEDEFELELADEDTELSQSSPKLPAQEDLSLEPELGDTDALSSGSELDLDEGQDELTAESSDLSLDGVESPSDPSDSILLSEEELGESVGPPASTIIGKSELGGEEDDLQLSPEDDVHSEDSELKLNMPGASDVHSSKIAGSGVLDTEQEDSGAGASAFEDLEELEIDLSAEASRAFTAEDVSQAKSSVPASEEEPSGLSLGDDSDLADGNDDMGSTDVPLLEIEGEQEPVDEGSGSEIDLADDLELQASDSGGSDITIEGSDSGINLISPSDSGLALDDIPLDIGGSAILSSLSLGGDSDPEISLVGDASGGEGSASLQTDDDFQLTPLAEASQEAEGDSSSQVIALDADIEALGEEAAMQFDEVDLTQEGDEAAFAGEDFGAPAGELGAGYAPTAAAGQELRYDVVSMLLLCSVSLILVLGSVLMLDLVWNIWSWREPFALSDTLTDAIASALGMI